MGWEDSKHLAQQLHMQQGKHTKKEHATDKHPEHATRRSASLIIRLEMQSLQV